MQLTTPKNASAGALVRKAAVTHHPRHNPEYRFARRNERGYELDERDDARMLAEARKRILTLTAAMEAERAEREAEAAARRERPLKPGKRGVMWNAVEDKEFEVTTSTGRKDAIHVKVWGGARRRPRESSSGGPLSLSLSLTLSLGDEA